jgi:hypothetical protein
MKMRNFSPRRVLIQALIKLIFAKEAGDVDVYRIARGIIIMECLRSKYFCTDFKV